MVLGREPVVDREPGEIGVGERLGGRDVHLRFVAAAPASAVHQNRYRKWPRAFRLAGVELQALAVDVSVLDVGMQLGRPGRRRHRQGRYRGKQLLLHSVMPRRA